MEPLEGEAKLAMEIENGKNGMKILTYFLWSWVIWLIGGLDQLNSIPRAVLNCKFPKSCTFSQVANIPEAGALHKSSCYRNLSDTLISAYH